MTPNLGSIMVVDDDPAVREIVGEILSEEGYEVIELANGRAALDCLRSGARPDLILLDLMMPVLDGWHFRREQLLDPTLARIPVVAMTAGPVQMAPTGIQTLAKPMSTADLLDVASRYARRLSTGESSR
jgi:CheY-like chemotaxis protein